MHSPWDYTDPNWSRKTKTKYDPTAKRPNQLCDPYGQGGKPLSYEDAAKHRVTLHTDWIFDMPPAQQPIPIPQHVFNDGTTAITTNQQEESLTTATAMKSDMNTSTESFENTAPLTTTRKTFTSADDVQRALSDLQQISSTKTTAATVMARTPPLLYNSHAGQSVSASSGSSSNSNYALDFPMYTASEQLQRTFASIPPSTTTPLQPIPTNPQQHGTRTTPSSKVVPPHKRTQSSTSTSQAVQQHPTPLGILRTFQHADFMSGTRFLHSIAAVGQLTAHYPILTLERKIIMRQWYVISTIKCHTLVLGGLSTFDFHLAAMIDVEVERPEVQKNLLNASPSNE